MSDLPNAEVICKSILGKELSVEECSVLATVMNLTRLNDKETLVQEGGSDQTLFLLAEGKLAVVSKIEEKETVVYTMTSGECAGTRAFVDQDKRRATLRAVGKCIVYSMEPSDFETLLDNHPRIVYKVMRALFRITHANLMRMNMESQELAKYISKSGGRY